MSAVKEKKRLAILVPDWNAPEHVFACTTMRQKSIEEDSYSKFNLATHVGDNNKIVEKNRLLLTQALALPSEPVWLGQTHSTKVLNLDGYESSNAIPEADAAFTSDKNKVCVILTADCLPIVISDMAGKGVLAIHAGWRGLADGIIQIAIEKFTKALDIKSSDCCVWLGPAISQENFEVGKEVYTSFVSKSKENKKAFVSKANDKFLCDLYLLARLELQTLGISAISGGEHCTYAQEDKFYSYRRHTHQLDKVVQNNAATGLPSFLKADSTQIKTFSKDCGRQATLIWLGDKE